MLSYYLKSLELPYFEVTEAFKGLADENVWKRPAVGLLSVGELAGHIAFWEAVRFASGSHEENSSPDLSKCKISSPLLDGRFRYYQVTLATPPSPEHLAMSGGQVLNELLRVHRESMDYLTALNPDLESKAPFWAPRSNFGELLTYVGFHISYHTGQMYTVRHLLGEEPPDN